MAYRTSEAQGAARFSDRQVQWMQATVSQAEVEANLRGTSVTLAPHGALDEIGQVCAAFGLLLVLGGGYAYVETRSWLGLLPAALGVALLGCALLRRRLRERARRTVPGIEILTFVPVFERRVEPDHEGAPVTFEYVAARDAPRAGEDLVWPSRLHALRGTLAPEEPLRICIQRRRGLRFIAWAHPL